MRLVDANILIYAYDRASVYHSKAREWLDEKLNGLPPLGMPWASLLAFARIVTNPRIYEKPAALRDAWSQVIEWTAARAAWIPQPTDSHGEIVAGIIERVSLSANDVPDVHLAALAVEHGLRLCSTDSDFAGYPEIEWENPLV
jgi:uncharacterized protein